MKKLGKIFICLLTMIAFPIGLASCNNNNTTSSSFIDSSTDTSTSSSEDSSSSSSTSTSVGKLDYDMSNVKFEDKFITYDGKEHTLEITGTLPEGVTVTYSKNTLVDVGILKVTASFKGDYEHYNEIPDMSATLTITKADYDMSNVKFEDKTFTYDGNKHSLAITGTLPKGVEVIYENNGLTNVGSVEVIAKFIGDFNNYNDIPTMSATLTISKATYDMSGISFESKTFTYNGSEYNLSIKGRLPKGVSVIYENNGKTNVGEYKVIAKFIGDGLNYNPIPDMTATLTIIKGDYDLSHVVFEDKTVPYDGKEHTLEIMGALPKGVSVTYTNNKLTEIGSIKVTAVFTGDYENYNVIKSKTATLTIVKGVYDMSNVKFEDKTVTYDKKEHSLEITGTLPEGVSVTYTPNKLDDIGILKVTASFKGDYEHYERIPDMTATLTVFPYVDKDGNYVVDGIKYKNHGKYISVVGYTEDINVQPTIRDQILNIPITEIGYRAFFECKKITYIVIPDSVTKIDSSAFGNCTGLTDILIPDSVTRIEEWTFNGCTSLENFMIGNGVTYIGNYAFNGCTKLSFFDTNNVTHIGDYAFKGCTGLTNVLISSSVTSIGSRAFNNCTGLTFITIPDNVTTIESGAFAGCTNLKNVKIGKGITSINPYMFSDCTILTSITIPNNITYLGSNVFYNCTGLTTITIPDSVLELGESIFANCTSLYKVSLPESLTNIGRKAFEGCNSLKTIKLPNSIYKIEDKTFLNCINLENVTIGNGVETIGWRAFEGCTNLKNITIPNSVTFIDTYVFDKCINLTSITLSNSVKKIGANAFEKCNNLKDVYFNGTESEWNLIDIGHNNECLTNATIHFI